MSTKLEFYTDGACMPNPGRGGWAVVAVENGLEKQYKAGGEKHTTNNRMELMAIYVAMSWFDSSFHDFKLNNAEYRIRIYTDSMLSVNVINGKWRAKKNIDLIEVIRKEMVRKKHEIIWVRGHNGNYFNERADEIANRAALTKINFM